MGSSLESDHAPSREFLAAFERRASSTGVLDFAEFVRLALYDPAVGYYSRSQSRVGYSAGTDFYTSATSGSVFGELVVAACVKLLRGRDPRRHVFVEVGAEPGRSVLDGVAHPFASNRVIRFGEPLDVGGNAVVFSNELFDAQPFRRFVFHDGAWRELGVALRGNALQETVLDLASAAAIPELPITASEGYIVDAPTEAAEFARSIAAKSWSGLFVACDYGKSWRELVEATPAGTARAYYRHSQSNELLARPGRQDLTCHVCWDWIESALQGQGFRDVELENQESFFIHHAESYLAPAIAADAGQLTARKRSLLQLIHGAHLGHKFQVLHALR